MVDFLERLLFSSWWGTSNTLFRGSGSEEIRCSAGPGRADFQWLPITVRDFLPSVLASWCVHTGRALPCTLSLKPSVLFLSRSSLYIKSCILPSTLLDWEEPRLLEKDTYEAISREGTSRVKTLPEWGNHPVSLPPPMPQLCSRFTTVKSFSTTDPEKMKPSDWGLACLKSQYRRNPPLLPLWYLTQHWKLTMATEAYTDLSLLYSLLL